MKRILYILTAAAIVLTGCTKVQPWEGNDSVLEEGESVYPDGAKVDLIFGIPAPIPTKGDMADKPEIDNLHVAIFDGSGALKEYVEATPLDGTTYVSENGIEGRQRFKATVTLKNAERRVHFIANGPEDVSGGMESSLVQEWLTGYHIPTEGDNAGKNVGEIAFWQRIVLLNGITAYTFSEKKKNGQSWQDGDYIVFKYIEESQGIYTSVSVEEARSHSSGDGIESYKIEFVNNRPYYVAGSMTVNPGDFVNAKGEKIVDGTGFFQSVEVAGAVNYVPMVRNFARIKIVPETDVPDGSDPGNFEPVEFYLMNIPDKGTIAPYSIAGGGFAKEFTSASSFDENDTMVVTDPDIAKVEKGEMTYAALLESLNAGRYPASIPSGGKLIQTPKEVKDNNNAIPNSWKKYTVAETLEGTESAFLFERGLPNKDQDPTYLLIGGNLTINGTSHYRWFKVELTDKNGRYERVFRGITYFMEISNITGSEGYETAALAAVGTPVSDVSNATATENLDQVNDGKGTAMWVEYIDYVAIPDANGVMEPMRILYKVFDSSTGDALSPTATVNGETVPRYTLSCDPESGGAVASFTADAQYTGSDTPDGKNDWRIATVSFNSPSTSVLSSTLTIAGITADGASSGSGKTLSRKVKYHVMNKASLTLSATALASEAAGEQTALKITLPKYLGYSMFPLILKIEAEKANLNPVASLNKWADGTAIDLPAETGRSYFSNQNTFYYLFTINYSDYYAPDITESTDPDYPYNLDFTLYFSTSKDYTTNTNGSNATFISVTDRNGRFKNQPDNPNDMYNPSVNKAVTELKVNGGNSYFIVSPVSQTVKPSDESATFSINTNGDNGWEVTPAQGVSGVWFKKDDPSVTSLSGTGNGVVTAYFDPNPNNASRPFDIKVTPTTGTAKTITITQAAPTLNLAATTASVSAATTDYDLNITSNTDWTAEVVSGDATIVKTKAAGDQVTGSGNGTVRISFVANGGTTAKTFKIKVYATDTPTISEELVLTQKRTPYETTKEISVNQNTFNTNYRYDDDDLSISMDSGRSRTRTYVELNNGGSITVGTAISLKSISIGYTDSNHTASTTSWTNNTGGDVKETTVTQTRQNRTVQINKLTITYLTDN